MKRRETRPGYVRVTLDLPTPLYERLSRYVEELKGRWGATEQGVCRALLDDGLTRAGYPPTGKDTGGKKARPSKK